MGQPAPPIGFPEPAPPSVSAGAGNRPLLLEHNPSPPPLRRPARILGNAVGTAASAVSTLPARFAHARRKVTEAVSNACSGRGITASQLSQRADLRYRNARDYAAEYSRRKPLEVLAGAAATGFVLGVVLKFWRGHRA